MGSHGRGPLGAQGIPWEGTHGRGNPWEPKGSHGRGPGPPMGGEPLGAQGIPWEGVPDPHGRGPLGPPLGTLLKVFCDEVTCNFVFF